jgi:hypothetical protein
VWTAMGCLEGLGVSPSNMWTCREMDDGFGVEASGNLSVGAAHCTEYDKGEGGHVHCVFCCVHGLLKILPLGKRPCEHGLWNQELQV